MNNSFVPFDTLHFCFNPGVVIKKEDFTKMFPVFRFKIKPKIQNNKT